MKYDMNSKLISVVEDALNFKLKSVVYPKSIINWKNQALNRFIYDSYVELISIFIELHKGMKQ